MKKETRCIICGEKKDGIEVKNDYVMDGLRWFKRNVTKNEKGYRLVVCKEDYPKYKKSRDGFQRTQWFYVALGLIFTIALATFSGPNIFSAIFVGLIVTFCMYLLSLSSYMPALNIQEQQKSAPN